MSGPGPIVAVQTEGDNRLNSFDVVEVVEVEELMVVHELLVKHSLHKVRVDTKALAQGARHRAQRAIAVSPAGPEGHPRSARGDAVSTAGFELRFIVRFDQVGGI